MFWCRGMYKTKGLHHISKTLLQDHGRTSTKRPEQNYRQFQHDDVIKWRHFPRYWPFVRGIHQSPVDSPHKGQWRGALMYSLSCASMNYWVNNREAGDLRRYPGHSDVTVVRWKRFHFCSNFTKLCCSMINWQVIGSAYGLAINGRQAIIWPNKGHDLWRHMAWQKHTELTYSVLDNISRTSVLWKFICTFTHMSFTNVLSYGNGAFTA